MLCQLKKIIAMILQKTGHLIPDIPIVRAIGNRILWPIHKTLKLEGGITDVLGVKMLLDPSECVDRNLWFTPHLYDKGEIKFAINKLKEKTQHQVENVFIDVGSNIGFWSLVISKNVKHANILSIEANPETAKILNYNISINNLNKIRIIQKGIYTSSGKIKLFCGNHGNRGGDSFKFKHEKSTEILVDVVTLKSLCDESNITSIKFMKMDIEGLEVKVLEHFFKEAPISIHPKYICLEHSHDESIDDFMLKNSYRCIKRYRENAIYSL